MAGHSGQADDKRATAVGGVGGDAAGDPAGGGAGGGWGDAAGGLGRTGAPGLAAYLLVPRRDAWGKALMAPACFVAAACSTGHFGGWARFTVLWLVLEVLIYPARYQWNDIAGVDADQRHPEAVARSRLPAGAVFVIAGSYEWLRASRYGHWTSARVVAVWLAVGLGYLVRGGLGLSTGGLAWGGAAMIAGLVCLGAFGIMFVLLTWALEATSYCSADDDGRWHVRPELAAKPHLAPLLRHVGEPLEAGGMPPDEGRYCGGDRVLCGGSRLSAPWNLALLVAAASGAVTGAALARPHAAGAAAWIAVAAAGLAGGVVLARCRSGRGCRAVTAGWFLVAGAAGLLARPGLPILAGVPWLVVAGLYCTFCGWSYRDLVAASPGRQRQILA